MSRPEIKTVFLSMQDCFIFYNSGPMVYLKNQGPDPFGEGLVRVLSGPPGRNQGPVTLQFGGRVQ